jgi:hypothetical protein
VSSRARRRLLETRQLLSKATPSSDEAPGYGVSDFIILTKYSVSHTIHLPTPTAGRELTIKDIGGNLSNSVQLSIGPHAPEKIENVAGNYVIQAPFTSINLVSDGTSWWVMN